MYYKSSLKHYYYFHMYYNQCYEYRFGSRFGLSRNRTFWYQSISINIDVLFRKYHHDIYIFTILIYIFGQTYKNYHWSVWFVFSNNNFQFLNNIICIFTHFFTHTYFHKCFQITIFSF